LLISTLRLQTLSSPSTLHHVVTLARHFYFEQYMSS